MLIKASILIILIRIVEDFNLGIKVVAIRFSS